MPFCPNCGLSVKPESVFCHNCGAKLSVLSEKTHSTLQVREKFDLKKHIETLRRDGMTKPVEYDIIPREYIKEKWDSKKYLEDISGSLMNGGFSYFTYIGVPKEKHAEGEVRERIPILLKDERLENVAQIVVEWGSWGTTWGPLYFTGRRFILDAKKAKFEDTAEDAVHSLPLSSFWIKPDFSDLFSILGVSFFLELGTFRKKRYNRLSYSATVMEKSPVLRCGYMVDGPNGKQFMNDEYQQFWSYVQKRNSIEELSNKINDLIAEAKTTKISELIKHTYTCHHMTDAMIETNPLSGPKSVSENPFSYWPSFLV